MQAENPAAVASLKQMILDWHHAVGPSYPNRTDFAVQGCESYPFPGM